MIKLKTDEQIGLMAGSGKVTGRVLYELRELMRPGTSTKDIDRFVEESILAAGMIPTFKGYMGFPANACVSINEELVHGIPDEGRKLAEGDVVSVDVGVTHKGWVSDAARTYAVGEVSGTAARMINTAKESFFEGLEACRTGNRLEDIGYAIQSCIEAEGFSVVLEYVGHGIGRSMWEDPKVKNYGTPGKGPMLTKGMALAIEPMLTEGAAVLKTLSDGWTVVTADGKLAAHYENTVVITGGEPLVLTLDERDRD